MFPLSLFALGSVHFMQFYVFQLTSFEGVILYINIKYFNLNSRYLNVSAVIQFLS